MTKKFLNLLTILTEKTTEKRNKKSSKSRVTLIDKSSIDELPNIVDIKITEVKAVEIPKAVVEAKAMLKAKATIEVSAVKVEAPTAKISLKAETPKLDDIIDIKRGLELSEINKRNIEKISDKIKKQNYVIESSTSKYGK